MIDISLAKFRLASILICSQYSRQLKAISMMSWLSSKCCDFSFVKITIKDFMRASRNSLFCFEYSVCWEAGTKDRPVYRMIYPPWDCTDWSPNVFDWLLFFNLYLLFSLTEFCFSETLIESTEFFFRLLFVVLSFSGNPNKPSSLGKDYNFCEVCLECKLLLADCFSTSTDSCYSEFFFDCKL